MNRIELVNEILKLLEEKSSNWNTIGRVMGISGNDRESLRQDITRNNIDKLEVIIDKWLTALPSEFTWDRFIDILSSLGYQDVIREVRQLKKPNKGHSLLSRLTLADEAVIPKDPSKQTIATKASTVIKSHFSDLSKAISDGPPDLLLSVSNRFYQHSFINRQAKANINQSGGLTGASSLLSLVMEKIEESDHYLLLAIDILREEVALTDIVIKMNGGYDTSIVPVWCRQELPFALRGYQILPVYRTIKDFNEHKQNNAKLFLDPFDIHTPLSHGSYRATLAVNPNEQGTHVGAYIHLMKGCDDDHLEFPITGIFTMKILKWKENSNHIERSIALDDDKPLKDRERVTTGERAATGWGYSHFLPHDDLMSYLHHDMMCFKIGYYPIKRRTGCSSVPNWCDVMYSTSATPPCTRTLYGYSAYKTTNCEWWSQPFYSSDKGYKLQLKVVANGDGSGKGTHLSLFVRLMKGEHDDTLSWPFNATITVQLLNWPSDNHHENMIISYHEAPIEFRQRVIEETTFPGMAMYDFISHTSLESPSDPTVRFINNDNICFRIISVDIIN